MTWFPLSCFLRDFKWKTCLTIEGGILLKHLGLIQTDGHHIWPLWAYLMAVEIHYSDLSPKELAEDTLLAVIPSNPLWCSDQCHAPLVAPSECLRKVGVLEVGLYLLAWGHFYQHSLPKVSPGWHFLRAALHVMFLQPTLLSLLSPFIGVRPT